MFLSLLLFAGFLALTHRTALAAAEFCPAQLDYRAIGQSTAPDEPGSSQLYSFILRAFGPRTVTARLAFYTDQGWFTASVPKVELSEKDLKYYTPTSSFVDKIWVSPVMYVRFASPLIVKNAWVRTASSVGDSFGWESQRTVNCHPARETLQKMPVKGPPWLITHDLDYLSLAPSNDVTALAPQPIAPFEKTDCPSPFQDATVKVQAQPEYPNSARGRPEGTETVNIIVALRADGSLADAWVFGSSGFSDLDDSALEAARESEYNSAVSFCQAIPAYYYFRVTYNPYQ